jgi:isoquinoline 1-oxidoreductase alpha subunit
MKFALNVNSKAVEIDADPDMPLLWALRDRLNLTGAKYGCGLGLCGACTVHLDGKPVRSCMTPVSAVKSARVTTIEGLSKANDHAVQLAWREERVPQCGYCQSGQLMTAAALLAQNPSPTPEQVREAFAGHICRCGTYPRIEVAVQRAAAIARKGKAP